MLSTQISDHPLEMKTHFSILEPANKQGQARYRCLTCNHEFRCKGKVRLIQHITGENPTHVKACPSPFIPLKENLIKRQQNSNKICHSQLRYQQRLNLGSREGGEKDEKEVQRALGYEESLFEASTPKVNEKESQNSSFSVSSILPTLKRSTKANKRKKRLNPSSQSPSYPSKKPSQPLTDYEVCNQHFMSLIRRMYEVVPEIVEQVIMLESMEDRQIEPSVSQAAWVSSLLTSIVTSPASSGGRNVSSGVDITFPLPSCTI